MGSRSAMRINRSGFDARGKTKGNSSRQSRKINSPTVWKRSKCRTTNQRKKRSMTTRLWNLLWKSGVVLIIIGAICAAFISRPDTDAQKAVEATRQMLRDQGF